MKNAITTLLTCFALLILPLEVQAHKSNEKMLREHRESVVLITTFTNITLTTKDTNVKYEREDKSYGTGVIIEHRGDVSFVMTAAHVCDTIYVSQIKEHFPMADPSKHDVKTESISAITDIDGETQPGFIYGMSPQLDVCLLMTARMERKAMRFAGREARIAEKVYSMGFPAMSHEAGVIPIFEGFFSGIDENGKAARAIYTIPTTGGSSGSPVFLENGRIVGITTTGNKRFQSWQGAVTYDQMVHFYKHFMKLFEDNEKSFVDVFFKELEKLEKIKAEQTPPIPDAVLPPVPGFE